MTLKTTVSIEDYLGMSFEHDREYVNGEIIERSMPTLTHGEVQAILASWFRQYRKQHNLLVVCEVRMRLGPDLVRIPDIACFIGRPDELPTTPPLVAIEIASPDDRLHQTLEKLAEYRRWGVPHVWLVEPDLKALYIYDGSLNQTSAFALPEYNLAITADEIFA